MVTWRMVRELVTWFGGTSKATTSVSAGTYDATMIDNDMPISSHSSHALLRSDVVGGCFAAQIRDFVVRQPEIENYLVGCDG
jgi:hypothetical protein